MSDIDEQEEFDPESVPYENSEQPNEVSGITQFIGLPAIRINTNVPSNILTALSRVRGKYSFIAHVFYCIDLGGDRWVGVAGDGDNGGYEHFVFTDGRLTISDVGYGCTDIALRDILNQEIR